jgi:hypothetical protein
MQTQVDAAMLRRENISFEGVWADIRRRLRVGTTIRNWGAVQGYTGKTFCIVGVDDTAIMVRSVRMNKRHKEARFKRGV